MDSHSVAFSDGDEYEAIQKYQLLQAHEEDLAKMECQARQKVSLRDELRKQQEELANIQRIQQANMKAYEIECQFRARKDETDLKEREAVQKKQIDKIQEEIRTHTE